MKIQRISKMQDRAILRLLTSYGSAWGSGENSTIVFADVHSAISDATLAEFQKSAKNTEAIDSFDAYTKPAKFVLRFRRGIGGADGKIDATRTPSPYFDEVGIEVQADRNGKQLATFEDVVQLTELVKKHAGAPPPPDSGPASATDLLHQQFSQLNELLADVTQRVHARQIQVDDQYQQRLTSLDQKFEEKQVEAEKALDAREQLVSERAKVVEARAREIDDRQHMHARRDLREKITSEIQGRLTKTLVHRQSFWVRWGVLGLMLVAAFGLGGMAFYSLAEYTEMARMAATNTAAGLEATIAQDVRMAQEMLTSGTIWYLLVRAALAGFGAVAFILYAISWLKRIYAEDVRAQRDLERYSIDLSRASWAIETIMEAKSAGDVTIPDMLVAGVSRNLFDTHGKHDSESNDALATFLRASIRGKIGPNGAEFDFNNKGTRRLAKEVEDNS